MVSSQRSGNVSGRVVRIGVATLLAATVFATFALVLVGGGRHQTLKLPGNTSSVGPQLNATVVNGLLAGSWTFAPSQLTPAVDESTAQTTADAIPELQGATIVAEQLVSITQAGSNGDPILVWGLQYKFADITGPQLYIGQPAEQPGAPSTTLGNPELNCAVTFINATTGSPMFTTEGYVAAAG
jgi:hypothetical protein